MSREGLYSPSTRADSSPSPAVPSPSSFPPATSSKRASLLPPASLLAPSPRRLASTAARVRKVEEEDLQPPPAESADIEGRERLYRPHEGGGQQTGSQAHSSREAASSRAARPPPRLHLDAGPLPRDEHQPDPPDALAPSSIPTTRDELFQLFDTLPDRPSRQDFLTLRNHAKRLNALDDVAFLSRFVLGANRAGYEDVGVRFFRQALKLLVAAKSDSPAADLRRVAESVLADLIARKRWMAALQISNALLAQNVSTPTLRVQRMQILGGRGRYADAIREFESFLEEKDPPPPQAFDIAINAHLFRADLGAAQTLLAEKAKLGMPPTVETYLFLLEGMDVFGGNRPMEDKMLSAGTEEQVRAGETPRQDVRILNRLMSVRAARGALRDALALLDLFDLEGLPRDVVDAYRSLHLPPLLSPHATMDGIRRPRPDVATVVILVGIALRQQQPDLAERLVVSGLRTGGIAFNDYLAAAMMRIHLARHDVSAAETLAIKLSTGSARFGPVELPPHEPSSQVFELLFAGLLHYRGLAGAHASFVRLREMFDTEVAVSEGMTLALVDYLSRGPISAAGLSSAVLLQIQELTQGKVRPEAKHLDVLLRAAWRRDRLHPRALDSAAQRIEDEFPVTAEEPENNTEAPPSGSASAIRRPPPTPRPAYTPPEAELLVRPGSNSSVASSASRLRESLTDRDVRHTRDTTRHIIRNDHLLRFIDAKWDYLQTQVVDLGIRPSYHHVTVLMRAYLRLGDARGADNVLRYATEELGLEPHVAYFSTLISGLARLGKYTSAARVYADFRASGLEPDRNLFAALAMSYARRRDVAAVERVLSEMRTYIRTHAPPPQIQAQALRTAASSNSTTRIPPALSMPYDPLLDAVFVNILYRAQTSSGLYLAAQDQVMTSLKRGMVPDLILLKSVQRTRKWIRHKENQLERSGAPVIHTGGHHVEADLRRDELAELKKRNAAVVSRIRKMVQRMSPPVEKKELRDLETYWEQVEKGNFEADSHAWQVAEGED